MFLSIVIINRTVSAGGPHRPGHSPCGSPRTSDGIWGRPARSALRGVSKQRRPVLRDPALPSVLVSGSIVRSLTCN
eukprot:1191592-Prorocentrum_minimum.AAC.2